MCKEVIKVGVIFFLVRFIPRCQLNKLFVAVVDKQTQVPIIGATVILENTAPLKGDDTNRW